MAVRLFGISADERPQRQISSGVTTPDPPCAVNEFLSFESFNHFPAQVVPSNGSRGSSTDTPPTPAAVGPLSGGIRASPEILSDKLLQLQQSRGQASAAAVIRRPSASQAAPGQVRPPPGLELLGAAAVDEPQVELANGIVPFAPGLVIGQATVAEQCAVPPPPQPLVARPPKQQSSRRHNEGPVVSIGTIGHPNTCMEACPYVKRKGGCKDGPHCQRCHLCFWQRPAVRLAHMVEAHNKVEAPGPGPGQGQGQGHGGGLEAAAAAPAPVHVVLAQAATGMESQEVAEEGPASVGSIGHPHACNNACKYHSKGKGCKDGRMCVRCHLCVWRRYHERA